MRPLSGCEALNVAAAKREGFARRQYPLQFFLLIEHQGSGFFAPCRLALQSAKYQSRDLRARFYGTTE
jgi:hypothetical protein